MDDEECLLLIDTCLSDCDSIPPLQRTIAQVDEEWADLERSYIPSDSAWTCLCHHDTKLPPSFFARYSASSTRCSRPAKLSPS
jgi:hypothetical protein